jgi:hypothetical protein
MERKKCIEKKDVKVLKMVYTNDNTTVSQTNENTLLFQSNNNILMNQFESEDCGESVACLMKVKDIFLDRKFWNIVIKEKYSFDVENILYWLTGGDLEWEINKNYKYTWEEIKSVFKAEYEDTILSIISNSYQLKDIKNGFIKHLNMPTLYEFSLKNNLMK